MQRVMVVFDWDLVFVISCKDYWRVELKLDVFLLYLCVQDKFVLDTQVLSKQINMNKTYKNVCIICLFIIYMFIYVICLFII